jgi:hypothetical protein
VLKRLVNAFSALVILDIDSVDLDVKCGIDVEKKTTLS